MLYEQRHISTFNFQLKLISVEVQDWYQSFPERSTPTPDPYPHSTGGQTLGMHWTCPTHLLHV